MRRILFLTFLIYSAQITFSQTAYKHPSTIGIHYLLNDFKNERLFDNFSKMDAGLGLSYLKGINRHLDYTIHIAGSFPDSTSKHGISDNKKHLFLQSDIAIRARALNKPFWIQPFVSGGVGFSYHDTKAGSYILMGPGMEFNHNEISLIASVQYRYSITNNLNSHFFYSVGIAGAIGKPKGKTSATSSQVVIPTIIRDRDGDGIVDTADSCPTVPGLQKFQGCPDSDNDGIEDQKDKCPFIFGLEKYQGCPIPDTDKDGIDDEKDQCIEVPGVVRYKGCPIPDTDKDGVNDELDSCINIPGVKENNGCPIIDIIIKEKIDRAAKNILFRTGSFELYPKSFASLNDVVTILTKNPSFTLSIEGHTDNSGNEIFNQELSEKRANVVLAYLLSKGIEQVRLKAHGYGQSKPIDTNKTKDGRANNRRVQLILQ